MSLDSLQQYKTYADLMAALQGSTGPATNATANNDGVAYTNEGTSSNPADATFGNLNGLTTQYDPVGYNDFYSGRKSHQNSYYIQDGQNLYYPQQTAGGGYSLGSQKNPYYDSHNNFWNLSDAAVPLAMMALPFTGGLSSALLGGGEAAAGAGALDAGVGAFDLGGVAGGVAGAGGETGIGSLFGLGGEAGLAAGPSAYDLANIGDGTGMNGSFLQTSMDAAGNTLPEATGDAAFGGAGFSAPEAATAAGGLGAAGAGGGGGGFSDAGYGAQTGIDPSYTGSNTASGFGAMGGNISNFLNSSAGQLALKAAPGILGTLLNKTPQVGGGAGGSLADAATAQGAANDRSALNSSMLSNPNINTPYGSQTVQYGLDGNPNHATINQTLSPVQQALFDQNNAISKSMGGLAQNSIGQVANSLSSPFDQSKLPPPAMSGNAGWQHAYDAILQRNQPIQDRDQSMLDTKLANQGIFNGSEAYKNAQFDQGQKVNDFRLGAQNSAMGQQQTQFGMDTSARQNAITQQDFFRQQPLNELNALRSGSQVTAPTFQQFQGTTAAPAPIFAGAQAQNTQNNNVNNANTASSNALTSGLFSLGSAALAAPKGTFSNLFSFGS